MILFNNMNAATAIAALASYPFNPEVDICIARVRHGELAGGVLYTNFTGASISMHVASFDPLWVNKDMLWVCFDYPFNQLKVKKIFGQVCENNLKALEFDRKLGFKEEARIRDVYPEGDMILLSMYRDDCRWLKMRRPDGFAIRGGV